MPDRNQQLIDLIFQMHRTMRQQLQCDEALSQITPLQLETLIVIKHNKDMQMRDIASHFRITTPSATSLINTLADMGFLARKSDNDDKRIIRLALSKTGEAFLQKAMKAKIEHINKFLGFVSEDDKNHMIKVLESILYQMNSAYETR